MCQKSSQYGIILQSYCTTKKGAIFFMPNSVVYPTEILTNSSTRRQARVVSASWSCVCCLYSSSQLSSAQLAPVRVMSAWLTDVVGGCLRSIHGAADSAAVSAVGRSTTANSTTAAAAARQRRMYTIESPRRADMGSVPDVSHVAEVGQYCTRHLNKRWIKYPSFRTRILSFYTYRWIHSTSGNASYLWYLSVIICEGRMSQRSPGRAPTC